MAEEDVVIVGAGIAGLATALALQKVGIRALVLEKAPGLRATGAVIGLFPNAWLALDALGVGPKLSSLYSTTKTASVTNVGTGKSKKFSLAGTKSNGSRAGPKVVHRKVLLETLANELPVDTIRFSCKITSIETQSTQEGYSVAVINLGDGTIIKSKILIGCDGIHSIVARFLGLATPVNSGRSAVRGMAVFPEGHGLESGARQFVEHNLRAGLAPVNDKDVYWFLVCKSSPPEEIMAGDPEVIQRELLENYAKIFPQIFSDMIRHCDFSTLTWAPLMFRYPWDVLFGNLRKDNITVAGDAMHPMTPDLGQGGCSALEDAVVLGRHIGNSLIKNGRLVPGKIGQALDGYVQERKWRVTWLVIGSYISGWVQQEGSNWWRKSLRDFFYSFILPRFYNLQDYDCGKLPSASSPFSDEENNSKKIN